MTNVARTVASPLSVVGGTPGKQTIVIAAPKTAVPGAKGAKLITTLPKVAGQPAPGGPQFIVVTSRPGGTTTALPAGAVIG